MDKRFAIALLIILGLFVGYFYVVKSDSTDSTAATSAQPTNHTEGAGNKKVTLLEYGDFQCPVCADYYQIVEEIQRKYGDDITFQYRHFPLDSIHPNARGAHRAAEAAGNQGKFFEMYDVLLANQASWASSSNSKAIFESYATELKLDLARFQTDYAAEITNSIINADLDAGKAVGVSGTPTFFLNGRLMEDDERRSLEDMTKAIDAEIEKVSATPQN
jgi:protein-disulfide isomerase